MKVQNIFLKAFGLFQGRFAAEASELCAGVYVYSDGVELFPLMRTGAVIDTGMYLPATPDNAQLLYFKIIK